MLQARHRMRLPAEFREATRSGVRCGRGAVVVHVARSHRGGNTLVGFVVSKRVGDAVRRNLVKRRLRAIMAEAIRDFPSPRLVVVRATESAASASYQELAEAVGSCLNGAEKRLARGDSHG